MAELVPFHDLLDRLREERAIGVDDYLAVGRLVARSKGASIVELRDALAALLGRDREGVARIREVFDELYGRIDDPEPTGDEVPSTGEVEAPVPSKHAEEREAPAEKPTLWARVQSSAMRGRALAEGKGREATWAGVLLVAIAIALVARIVSPSQPEPQPGPGPDGPIENPPTDPKPVSIEGPAAPVYATMPGCESWQGGPSPFQYAASGLVFFGFLFLIARSSYQQRGQAARRTLRRDRFASPAKNRTYDAPLAGLSPRLIDTGPLRLAAGALERRTQLDVPRSVDQTVRRGLLPVLAFGPRRGIARLLVLQETAPAADAFQPFFDAFVASLEGQGVEVERFYFRSDLSEVSRRRGTKPEQLARLTRHLTERAVVVLSTGEITPSSVVDLAKLLEPWPAKVLFSPLADRARVAPGLLDKRSPLPMFSLDSSGVREAARSIETGGGSARTRAPSRARVLPTQILRLRAMLAMALSPNYAIAERLRARFMPLVARDILRATTGVVREGARGADGTAALAWFREMDATPRAGRTAGSEERDVRSFLGALVEAAKPISSAEGEETLAELRWRRDRALLAAGSDDPGTREAAKRELAELGRGPLRAELDVIAFDTDELRTTLAKTPDAPAPEIGFAARARWALPSFPQVGAILLMAVVAGWGVGKFHEWRAQPFSLDGEPRTVLSDVELVRGLCQFDSFGAGWREPSGTMFFLGTIPNPSGTPDTTDSGVVLPSKQLTAVRIERRWAWFTVQAAVLVTDSLYGPEHLVVQSGGARAFAGASSYRPANKERVSTVAYTFGGTPLTIFPDAAYSPPDGFFPVTTPAGIGLFETYSPTTRYFSGGGGPGNIDWARAVHQRNVYEGSSALLPGTTEDFILRLVGKRALAVEPFVPEPEAPVDPDPTPKEPTEMTMSSFLTCDKPSGMRGPAIVTGRLKRNVTDEELKDAFLKQIPLPNRWTFETSPVEQNPVPGCFEFALPTTLKEPQDGERVQIVFEAFDCSKTIFAGCRQLTVRQVYRASVE